MHFLVVFALASSVFASADRISNLGSRPWVEKNFAETSKVTADNQEALLIKVNSSTEESKGNLDDLLSQFNLSYQIGPYSTKTRQSFIGNYFVRKDSYRLKGSFNLLSLLFDLDDSSLQGEISAVPEVSFFQYFKSRKEAWTKVFWPSANILTADFAWQKLIPGQLMHIRAPLNLLIGAKKEWDIFAPVEVRGEIAYLLTGQFDIFVFRGEGDTVRIRLVARRDKTSKIEGSAGVEDSLFSVFGIEIIDDQIVNLFGLDKMAIQQISKSRRNIYAADYSLNFSFVEVRDAYAGLFQKALSFKTGLWRTLNPLRGHTNLQNILISNVGDLDELYRSDLKLNSMQRRVERNFYGSSEVDEHPAVHSYFGIRGLWTSRNDSVISENKMTQVKVNSEGEEITERFLFPTWHSSKKNEALIGYYDESLYRSANIIFTADEEFMPTGFKSIGFYYDLTDKKYRPQEHKSVLEHFRHVLPPSVYQELVQALAVKNLDKLEGRLKNAKVSARYFIEEKGLQLAESWYESLDRKDTKNQIKIKIQDYLQRIQYPVPTLPVANLINDNLRLSVVVSRFQKSIDRIADYLSVVLNRYSLASERTEAFRKLGDERIFRQIGPGFLFSIVDNADFKDFASFEIYFIDSKRLEPVSFSYGSVSGRIFYEQIQDFQDIVNDVSLPDLRDYSSDNEDTLTKRPVRQ